MEKNPEEKLFKRLAVVIGESLEEVLGISENERRQLVEALSLDLRLSN